MALFFDKRTKSQLIGDAGYGAISGAQKGLIGGLLMQAVGYAPYAIPTLGAALPVIGACALGGALVVIPAMAIRNLLPLEEVKYSYNSTLFAKLILDTFFRAVSSFIAGCVGAAILGLAVLNVGLVAASASLLASVGVLLVTGIRALTAPKVEHPDPDMRPIFAF